MVFDSTVGGATREEGLATNHCGLLTLDIGVLLSLPPSDRDSRRVQLSSSRHRMLDFGASQEDVKPRRERFDTGRRSPAAGPSLHVSVTGGKHEASGMNQSSAVSCRRLHYTVVSCGRGSSDWLSLDHK